MNPKEKELRNKLYFDICAALSPLWSLQALLSQAGWTGDDCMPEAGRLLEALLARADEEISRISETCQMREEAP